MITARRTASVILCIAALPLLGERALAVEIFRARAWDPTQGNYSQASTRAQAHGDSLEDLVGDVITSAGDFESLAGVSEFESTVALYGVAESLHLVLEETTGGTSLTLRSRLTGLEERFVGDSRGKVEEKLVDWLLGGGASELADIMKGIDERSPVAVSDGNPNSTTARMASDSFESMGFSSSSSSTQVLIGEPPDASGEEGEGEEGAPAAGGPRLAPGTLLVGLGYNGGTFTVKSDIGDIRGSKMRLTLPITYQLHKRLVFQGAIPIDLTRLENTDVYGIGATAGLMYHAIFLRSTIGSIGWSFGPLVGGAARGTMDGASAALMRQVGLHNRLQVQATPDILLTFATQAAQYKSLDVEIGEVSYNPEISSSILKNGGKLTHRVNERFLYEAYLIDTRFLGDAAVDWFETFGAGITWNPFGSLTFSAGGNVDLGPDYRGYSYGLSSAWAF